VYQLAQANMHHPEICQILLTIDDYFLLSDSEREPAQIHAIIENPQNHESKRGISIKQILPNGCLKVYIYGDDKDGDDITFEYIHDDNDDESREYTIEVKNGGYAENVRDAVRTILKLDRGIEN
jgi:hypothetical protein